MAKMTNLICSSPAIPGQADISSQFFLNSAEVETVRSTHEEKIIRLISMFQNWHNPPPTFNVQT